MQCLLLLRTRGNLVPPPRSFSNPVKLSSMYLWHAINSIMRRLEPCLLALVVGEGRGKQLEQAVW